jgi:transposase
VPRTRPPYPEEFKHEAIELVRLTGKSARQVAADLGISEVSLRNWIKQSDADAGERPDGLSNDEREELRRLRRENQTLRMERKKSRGLLRQGDRRAVAVFRLIAAERANFPVSVMSRVLGVSRAGLYAWLRRRRSRRWIADSSSTHSSWRSFPAQAGPRPRLPEVVTDGVVEIAGLSTPDCRNSIAPPNAIVGTVISKIPAKRIHSSDIGYLPH